MKDLSLIALDNRWRQHELNIPREPCGVKPLIKKRPETFSPATVCAKSMPEKKKKKREKKRCSVAVTDRFATIAGF